MNSEAVVEVLLRYLYETNEIASRQRPLPLDQSLVEIGVLDSYGVIELVDYIENYWAIRISDADLTRERFGGLTRMATVIQERLEGRGNE